MDNAKKNYFWNTLGTASISFISLILLVIVTRINGIDDAGIFSFSFSSACIINVFALFCGRTFQVTDDNKEISEITYIVSRILTAGAGILISILFCYVNSYDVYKTTIFVFLCTLKALEAICDVFYGISQKRNHLYIAGKSMFFRTIISVIGFLLIDFLTRNLILSCLFLLIVCFVFLIFLDYRNASKEIPINLCFEKKEINLFFQRSIYTCCFSLIVMIAINIPKYAIDYLSTNSIQAVYGIISMPATFIMLFGQFILQPSLTGLATAYHTKNIKAFNSTVIRISSLIFGSLIIILPIVYFLGIPILNLIYGVNLNQYKWLLILIIIGATFYAVSQVLLNALITIRCTKKQFYLQICTLLLSILIAVTFVKFYGLIGSVISYFSILFLQFVFYLILYKTEINIKFN